MNPFAFSPARALAVLRMQCHEFARDFGGVFMSLAFPLLLAAALVAYHFVGNSFQLKFGIVDTHRNADAKALMQALSSHDIASRRVDVATGLAELKNGKLHALLVLPREALSSTGVVDVVVEGRLQSLVSMAMEAARVRLLEQGSPTADTTSGYTVKVSTFDAGSSSRVAFILPGMLALALVQLGLFSTTAPLLKARERGTLRYMLMTPLNVLELMAGQVALRVLVACLQVTLLVVVVALAIPMAGETLLALAGVSALGVAMLVAIGYALAGLPRSFESGMALVMFVGFAMMFGGNIFWDPSDAPILKTLAHLMPSSYLADAYRQIISGGEGLWPLTADISAMTLWTLAAAVLAARTFSLSMSARRRGPSTLRAAAARAAQVQG